MGFDDILLGCEEKMEKAAEFLKSELRMLRTGRATPSLVENIKVEYYGTSTPLKQLATISIPNPRSIVIKPFDPSSAGEIQKAIFRADLGLSPTSDGKLVRLAVPPLSEETRQQLAASVKKMGEESKVTVRQARRDANKNAEEEKKSGSLSEDDVFNLKEEVQQLTTQYEEQIEKLVAEKAKDLMEI